MARRNTKADRILNESAMRLEAAIMRERLAQSQLNTAKAVLEAVQAAHDALTREFTPQPRTAAKKPVASAPALLPVDKEAKCGICGNVKDHADHDRNYLRSHDFEPPKVAARAGRKSRPKPGATSSVPSSEIETVTAIAAGAGD